MCGIAGVYAFDQRVPPGSLTAMAAALKHRGPDEEGIYSSGPCGFAHRRLKIIDLSSKAAQPMQSESGRYCIIFNGEIYNFRELKRELEAEQSFFSSSDTEVILKLFHKYRQNAWSRLNGMYAFALYDSQTRELFIVRDHAGIKPLYYSFNSDHLLFASEIKAILSTNLSDRSMSHTSLSWYLQFGYLPGTRTIYEKISKLPAGHFLRISPAGMEIQRYWNVRDFFARTNEGSSQPELRLEELLQRSVEHQMISDVPVGAFLSGGIDSSLIVALMSKVSGHKVKTFTIGFPSLGYYDERPHARKVADHFRTEHHEYSVEKNIDEIVERLAEVFDEPFADSSAVPTLCLSEITRSKVTVALSGTGGDEVFGGYRKYMAAHWSSFYEALPASVRTQIRKTASLLPSSRRTLWEERALLLQRFTSLSSAERPEHRFNQVFNHAEIEEITGVQFREVNNFEPIEAAIAENMMLFDFEQYLPDDLLVKEDRCTMAYGLEARVPFLDRLVIEFMTAQPLHQKVTASTTKRLFKRVAKRYLPKEILQRPKHGFGSPVSEWLKTDLSHLMNELLLGSSRFLKSSLIQTKVEEHLGGKADHSRQLWTLMMLELWYRGNSRRSAL